MFLKQLILAIGRCRKTQGDAPVQAKPSKLNSTEFWQQWIIDIVDPGGLKGYARDVEKRSSSD